MKEAFVAADKLRPDLIILFSDMQIDVFPPRPRANVIFLSTDNGVKKVPYGVLVKVPNV